MSIIFPWLTELFYSKENWLLITMKIRGGGLPVHWVSRCFLLKWKKSLIAIFMELTKEACGWLWKNWVYPRKVTTTLPESSGKFWDMSTHNLQTLFPTSACLRQKSVSLSETLWLSSIPQPQQQSSFALQGLQISFYFDGNGILQSR